MVNPYQSAQESSEVNSYGQSEPSGLMFHFESKESLLTCKGWVRFISVLGFILFCLMFVISFYLALQFRTYPEMLPSITLLFLIVFEVMILMLATRLSKYGAAIKRFSFSQQSADFDVVMLTQLKFWTLFALTMLVFAVFLLFSIVSSYFKVLFFDL